MHKIKIKILIIIVIIIILILQIVSCSNMPDDNVKYKQLVMDIVKQYEDNTKYKQLVIDKVKQYKDAGINYKLRLADYDAYDDYFNYGSTKNYRISDTMQLDSDGVPKVKRGDKFYYNPVTVSQYCLTVYGKYLKGKDTLENFIKATDKLVSLQDDTGAFRYQNSFKYYITGQIMEPGWVSGMAQGQAISVLTRAYYATKDIKYLESAKRSLEFLITPIEQGGTMGTLKDLSPLLDNYIIFEEYIANPHSYTLNGFMFTLIGLYDYTRVDNIAYCDSVNMAKDNLDKGIETLKLILPLYDLGGITAYDLGFITYNTEPHIVPRYHAVHIQLLNGLHSVLKDNQLLDYFQKWASYIEEYNNDIDIKKSTMTNQDYVSLLNKFPIEEQGYGLEPKLKEKTEQPMTYALIISSESLHYKVVENAESAIRIRNAVNWIIENSDLNNDGSPGWGLPQPFDAFSNGTINPENHPYTITTAMVIEGLLDTISIEDFWTEAEEKQIKDLISDVVLYWLENDYVGDENIGYLGYSLEPTDMYYTPNVSGMFLSSLVRILTEQKDIFDDTQREIVTQKTHSIANKLMETVILKDGIPYWHYVINTDKSNEPRLNDLVHHIYTLWGVEEYRDHFDRITIQFSRDDSIASVDSYMRENKIYSFPQNQVYTGVQEQFNERPSNLWGVGMQLAFYSKYGKEERAKKCYKVIENEYGPIPSLRMWPMEFSKDDKFYERYAVHVLLGIAYRDFYNNSSEF